jgi:hypothetical protein
MSASAVAGFDLPSINGSQQAAYSKPDPQGHFEDEFDIDEHLGQIL